VRGHQHPERLPVTGTRRSQRPRDVEVGGGFKATRRSHRHTVAPGYDNTDEFILGKGSDTNEGVDKTRNIPTAGRYS
jgi:hypothetical protein